MEEMDDEQLAATVYVWRTKALLGDQEAADIADMLEAELKRRIGPTPSMQVSPLETPPRTCTEAASVVTPLTISSEARLRVSARA